MDVQKLSLTLLIEQPPGKVLTMDKVMDVVTNALTAADVSILSFTGDSEPFTEHLDAS